MISIVNLSSIFGCKVNCYDNETAFRGSANDDVNNVSARGGGGGGGGGAPRESSGALFDDEESGEWNGMASAKTSLLLFGSLEFDRTLIVFYFLRDSHNVRLGPSFRSAVVRCMNTVIIGY